MTTTSNVLRVTQLVKRFPTGKSFFSRSKNYFTAVNGISFSIAEGEILGLLGTNGAGKTTTIQMLLSLMTPTSGSIEYFGKELEQYRSEILQDVSFASTYVQMPSRLTVFENLDIYGRLYGLSREVRIERIEKYLKFFGMWNLKDRETGVLSAGQMTRAILAKAFINEPKVVLLDEPTASLDPDIAHDVREFVLDQQKQHGVSMLFTSHNMDEVSAVCDRVLVMKQGEIIANNTPDELAASVSNAHVMLLVNTGIESLHAYCMEHGLSFEMEKNQITIAIDEQKIPHLLNACSRLGIEYSSIAIDKPTLEDYFLQVAQAHVGERK